jgi:hypothetical protein
MQQKKINNYNIMTEQNFEKNDRMGMTSDLINLYEGRLKHMNWNYENDFSKQLVNRHINDFVQNIVSKAEGSRIPYEEDFGSGIRSEGQFGGRSPYDCRNRNTGYIENLTKKTFIRVFKYITNNYKQFYIRKFFANNLLNYVDDLIQDLVSELQKQDGDDTPTEYYYLPLTPTTINDIFEYYSFEGMQQNCKQYGTGDANDFNLIRRKFPAVEVHSNRLIQAKKNQNLYCYGTEYEGDRALYLHVKDKGQISFWIYRDDSYLLISRFVKPISMMFPEITENTTMGRIYDRFNNESFLGIAIGITIIDAKLLTESEYKEWVHQKTADKPVEQFRNIYEFFLRGDEEQVLDYISRLEVMKKHENLTTKIRNCMVTLKGIQRFKCLNSDNLHNQYKGDNKLSEEETSIIKELQAHFQSQKAGGSRIKISTKQKTKPNTKKVKAQTKPNKKR